MRIHPSAIVDASARVADSAEIGPYSIIGADVEIGAGTRLVAHCYIDGPTWIGEENVLYPYCVIGVSSPDKKYHGEYSETRIGNRNTIREYVTIHRGTPTGGGVTRVGDGNLLMANAHVAHDCLVGDNTVLANAATLGGHVSVGDWATVGAYSGVHQFCRVGRYAFIGGYSVITQDVLPFSNATTARESKCFGANKVGLERRGFQPDRIDALNKALRLLSRAGLNTTQALERIRADVPPGPDVEELLEFIQSAARGFIK